MKHTPDLFRNCPGRYTSPGKAYTVLQQPVHNLKGNCKCKSLTEQQFTVRKKFFGRSTLNNFPSREEVYAIC